MQIAVETDLKFLIEAFESQYIWQFIFALWAKGVFCGNKRQFSWIAATYANELAKQYRQGTMEPLCISLKTFWGNFQGACSCVQAHWAVFVLFLLSWGSMAVIFLQKDEEVYMLYINQMTWTKTDSQQEENLISLILKGKIIPTKCS